jgi:DNA polymerase I-like protein with 3'-5' exonuclease and polymerase domains
MKRKTMKRKNYYQGGEQLLLIKPPSSWTAPTELPDLRELTTRVVLDVEGRDDGLATKRGPGWATGAGHLTGVAIAWMEGSTLRSAYYSIQHPESDNFDRKSIRRWLLDHRHLHFAFHNAHYDIGWIWREFGVELLERVDDTACMGYMVDENRLNYGLDYLCRWRGLPGKRTEVLEMAAECYHLDPKREMHALPARYVGEYAEQDAASTLLLAENLDLEIEQQNLGRAYQLEMNLVPMVHHMRRRGVRIDLDRCEQLYDKFTAESRQALDDISDRLGQTVGIDQLRSGAWLERTFDALKIEYPRTANDRGSFEAKWMRYSKHWLPPLIVQAKSREDMAEKFIMNYLVGHRSAAGRVHPSINQYRGENLYDEDARGGGTRTYRFSYSDPPLQQIPHRDEAAAEIRSAFVPEESEEWCSADYCHDEETEILTEEGWIKFSLLSEQRVAQWSQQTETIEWIKPLSKYVGDAKPRVMTSISSKRVDLCVTAEHRVLLEERDTGRYQVVRACDVDEQMLRRDWIIPQRTQLVAQKDYPVRDEMLRLVVALQADASDRWQWHSSTWVLKMRKERKRRRLLRILRALGVPHRVRHNRDSGWMIVRLDDREEFREWLGFDKTFNREKMFLLSQRQRMVFLEELMLWDGSRRNELEHGGIYTSTNEKNVQTVSALAILSGYHSITTKWPKKAGKKPCWSTYAKAEDYERSVRGGTRVVRYRTVNRVYCVTVPSGFIVTRRGGRVAIGGQSQQEYRLIVHYAALRGMPKADEALRRYQEDPDTDFHQMVADMTGLDRKPAKDCNFAKAYGAGVRKFALMTNKSKAEAEKIMRQYDAEMPFVKMLYDECVEVARKRGYIVLLDGARVRFDLWFAGWRTNDFSQTWSGATAACGGEEAARRCADPEHPWYGKQSQLRRAGDHKALNSLIQGGAARQTKIAMRDCWRAGFLPLLQIHDELCFSLASREDGAKIADIMREAVPLAVPMKVDVDIGSSWWAGRA